MRLKKDFFARGAEVVARDLLGKILVHKFPNCTEIRGVIVETEAYIGEHDLASHARAGRTKRTEAMYGEPGTIYMFFTYGVHWMLNIVCSKKDDPQAVLIRGLDIITGPARLTKLLELDGSLYGEDITKSQSLWIEENNGEWSMNQKKTYNTLRKLRDYEVCATPRIGIDYAGDWKDRPLRFLIKDKV